MKLFVDDVRECPKDFLLFRPDDLPMFYHLAKHCGADDIISLDHDLGEGYANGHEILNEIERMVRHPDYQWWNTRGMPTILIHSANLPGRINMEADIRAIKKYLDGLNK